MLCTVGVVILLCTVVVYQFLPIHILSFMRPALLAFLTMKKQSVIHVLDDRNLDMSEIVSICLAYSVEVGASKLTTLQANELFSCFELSASKEEMMDSRFCLGDL